MILSGSITITGIADTELSRISLSAGAIVVDPYNVQAEPLAIRVELVSGTDVMPASAYVSVQALSMGKPIEGAVTDFGYCSEASFTIPARDPLYATATAVRVEAYADAGRQKPVGSSTVSIICSGQPVPVPRGSEWTDGSIYRNGDFLEHTVNGSTSIYMWASRVEGNTTKAPWDITLTTDPDHGYWTHITEQVLFATRMLLAKGALIGSSVFSGNYTISQQGIDKDGRPSSDYGSFGEYAEDGKALFTPNVMIDWLTGRIEALEMVIKGNSVFGGMLNGAEGSFRRLECVDGKGRKIVITPSPNGVDNPSVDFFNADGKRVIGIEMEDDAPFNHGTIELSRYDADGNQTNCALLHSNGIMSLIQPNSRITVSPTGITFSKPDGNFWKDSMVYPGKRTTLICNGGTFKKDITPDVSMIWISGGTNHIYLPDPAENSGRCIYLKLTSGMAYVGCVLDKKILDAPSNSPIQSFNTKSTIAFAAVSSGGFWNIFFCG